LFSVIIKIVFCLILKPSKVEKRKQVHGISECKNNLPRIQEKMISSRKFPFLNKKKPQNQSLTQNLKS